MLFSKSLYSNPVHSERTSSNNFVAALMITNRESSKAIKVKSGMGKTFISMMTVEALLGMEEKACIVVVN